MLKRGPFQATRHNQANSRFKMTEKRQMNKHILTRKLSVEDRIRAPKLWAWSKDGHADVYISISSMAQDKF